MQIFELYFNPKNETKVFEGFHYKPKDVYEGKLGRLYMVGEISDCEKSDASFLQNIFHLARETYYRETSLSPEKAFKKTLKEVNDFIKEKDFTRKLDLVLVASKNFSLYLGKIGETKTLLLSGKKTNDIGKELESSGSNLFSNMISGKMQKNDKLLILTPEVYNFFVKRKIIDEIVKKSLDKEVMEKISALQKEKFSYVSGVGLVMDHTITIKDKEERIISKNNGEFFSLKEMFIDTVSSVSKLKPINLNFKKPEIKIKRPSPKKKTLLLPLLLLGVVVLGSLVIGVERNVRIGKQREQVQVIEEKIIQGREEKSLSLLKEAFFDLEKIIEENNNIAREIEEMYVFLEKELIEMSMGEYIEEIKVIGETKEEGLDKIVLLNGNVYLLSSLSEKMSVINTATGREETHTLPLSRGVDFSTLSSNKIFLFSSPNTLVTITENEITTLKIDFPSAHENFVALSSFIGHPYFLDNKGDIFRYFENTPSQWLQEGEEKIEKGISMAIDGSIFILNEKNNIFHYHEGKKQNEFNPLLFPPLSNGEKIYTSSQAPLFILDKKEERIVVLDKEGSVLKQLFSEKFSNLKDIAISSDGKKIYLLIDQEVYLLEL